MRISIQSTFSILHQIQLYYLKDSKLIFGQEASWNKDESEKYITYSKYKEVTPVELLETNVTRLAVDFLVDLFKGINLEEDIMLRTLPTLEIVTQDLPLNKKREGKVLVYFRVRLFNKGYTGFAKKEGDPSIELVLEGE